MTVKNELKSCVKASAISQFYASKMEVLLADEYGFCFGVERAVEMVEDALDEGVRPIRSLGPLIHNAQEMERLGELGVSTIDIPDEADADTIAVGPEWNFRSIGRLVNDHPDIPGHFQGIHGENVFADIYREVRHRRHLMVQL